MNCEETIDLNCNAAKIKNFERVEKKFYNHFYNERSLLEKKTSTFFFYLNFSDLAKNGFQLANEIIDHSTYLLTLEINFYNKETEVWTILKGFHLFFSGKKSGKIAGNIIYDSD